MEHMPGRQRNAFVGVDFLSAGTWVKCVKMVQGPTPQAGGKGGGSGTDLSLVNKEKTIEHKMAHVQLICPIKHDDFP